MYRRPAFRDDQSNIVRLIRISHYSYHFIRSLAIRIRLIQLVTFFRCIHLVALFATRPFNDLIISVVFRCEVMDFDCGANHMVALTTDQELFSWGIGDSGRLGLDHYKGANHPRAIDGQVFESNVVKISCGVDTSCFITRNNKVSHF